MFSVLLSINFRLNTVRQRSKQKKKKIRLKQQREAKDEKKNNRRISRAEKKAQNKMNIFKNESVAFFFIYVLLKLRMLLKRFVWSIMISYFLVFISFFFSLQLFLFRSLYIVLAKRELYTHFSCCFFFLFLIPWLGIMHTIQWIPYCTERVFPLYIFETAWFIHFGGHRIESNEFVLCLFERSQIIPCFFFQI